MKPNIIFVLLDGSRWDRLDISEEFSELREQGLLFNNVTAAYPYTFAAMNAVFTGLFGKENGVDAYYKMFRLKDSVSFLPEILQENGFFTSCDLISNKVITKRGFDIHQSHDEYTDDLTKRHPELIKKSFDNAKDKPVFAFLQYSQIHTVTVSEVLKKYEWNDEKFYKNKNKNLENYDESFKNAGKYAKIIKDTVDQIDTKNETIFVFFCDHGTGVGERFGERNYGVFTFEETIRTFYLFINSKIRKNKICEKIFSSTQIFSTLLELCEISIEKYEKSAKSFSPYILNENVKLETEETVFSETGGLQGPFPSPKKPNVFCAKTSKYKIIFYETPNRWELYDLINDPFETTNIFGTNIEDEKILQEKLLNWKNR